MKMRHVKNRVIATVREQGQNPMNVLKCVSAVRFFIKSIFKALDSFFFFRFSYVEDDLKHRLLASALSIGPNCISVPLKI